MKRKNLAIRMNGLDDVIAYDRTLFSFISAEFSKYKSGDKFDEYSYSLGSGFGLKTNDNDGYSYVCTDIREGDLVYKIVDPDDGGGEKLLGTINEIKKFILDILPEKYKDNELELFIHEDEY